MIRSCTAESIRSIGQLDTVLLRTSFKQPMGVASNFTYRPPLVLLCFRRAVRPVSLCASFVDDLLHELLGDDWSAKLVAYDLLEFLGGESDDMFLERVKVHVCCVG